MDGGTVAQIFEHYNLQLRQDYLERGMSKQESTNALLQKLQGRFTLMSATLRQFGLSDIQLNTTEIDIYRRELENRREENQGFVEANLQHLSTKQRQFFDNVCNAVSSKRPALFFLDAAAGRGKTFVLQILLSHLY